MIDGEEKEFEEVACPMHGRTDEFLVFRASGKIVGIFCHRCLADFLTRGIGQAEPIYPKAE